MKWPFNPFRFLPGVCDVNVEPVLEAMTQVEEVPAPQKTIGEQILHDLNTLNGWTCESDWSNVWKRFSYLFQHNKVNYQLMSYSGNSGSLYVLGVNTSDIFSPKEKSAILEKLELIRSELRAAERKLEKEKEDLKLRNLFPNCKI
jgi:hypothetical protein